MTPDELVRMIAAGETLADMSALIRFGEPLIFMSDSHKNARVHFFARRVHFAPYFHEADFLKIACRAFFTNENEGADA